MIAEVWKYIAKCALKIIEKSFPQDPKMWIFVDLNT